MSLRQRIAALIAGEKTAPFAPSVGSVGSIVPNDDRSWSEVYRKSATYYAGARRLAFDLAGSGFSVYAKRPGGRQPVRLTPENDRTGAARVFASANPLEGKTRLWMGFWMRMFANGHAYQLYTRGAGVPDTRPPIAIWNLMAAHMTIEYSDTTGLPAAFVYRPDGGGEKRFTPREVYHARFVDIESDAKGLAPLEACQKMAEIEIDSARHWSNYFRNGTRVGETIMTDAQMNPTQVKQWEKAFEDRHKGVGNFWRTLLLPWGMKRETSGTTPKDADFAELFQLVREMQLAALGVMPAMVGILRSGGLSDSNVREQVELYWESTVLPHMRLHEEDMNEIALPWFDPSGSLSCRYNYDEIPVLQDMHARRIKQALEIGLMSPNDARTIRGRKPVPGGDVVFAPAGLQIVGDTFDKRDDDGASFERSKSADNGLEADDPARATLRAKAASSFSAIESDNKQDVRDWVRDTRERVIARLPDNSKATKAPDVEDVWQDDVETREGVRVLTRIYARTTKAAGTVAAEAIGGDFLLDDPAVQAFVRSNAARQVRHVSRATRRALRDVLTHASENNLSVREIAAILRSDDRFAFGKARAERIARTETARAYNASTVLAWSQQDGLVEEKEWLTAGDERVRDSHAHLDGERVGLEDNFSNGLAYPGDESGPPEETVNCRCTLQPVLSGEKRVRIAGSLDWLMATPHGNGHGSNGRLAVRFAREGE